MVLPPIRRRAILGIVVLGGLLLLVVAIQAAFDAIEGQGRADLAEKVKFRSSSTCTRGELLRDHDEATMRRLQEHYFRVRR